MTNETDHRAQMAAALQQIDTAGREFLALWGDDLPAADRERIVDLLTHGVSLGLHVCYAGTPAFEVTATDSAGGRQVLTTITGRADAMRAN
ncbi:MAG: hypothetical protein LC121_25035 [Anaerolineae bacterium]|nr:hypothetical protein [Anaerolineae bacterium]